MRSTRLSLARFAIPSAAIALAAFAFVFMASAASPPPAEWPQFLGPFRNGVSPETGLIDALPKDGPTVVWRQKGGVGLGGVSIVRGQLVTMVQREGKQFLVAHDAKSGKPLWQTEIAPEYRNSMGDGPRAAPAISGNRIFTYTGEGVLAAVNFADGKLLWKVNAVQELGGKVSDYGMASSPLVTDELVIVTVGAPKATVAAYNKESGKLAWTAGNDPAGYSSAAVLDLAGREQVVVFTGASAIGLTPDKGELLWRYPYVTNFECNIITPIKVGDRLLLSAGENHGTTLLDLKTKGQQIEPSVAWESLETTSTLRSEWQTPLVIGGYIYGFDNVGGAGPISHLTCIDAADGKRVWQQVRFGKGNFIQADGKVFIITFSGELVLARFSPKGYEELGRAPLVGRTRQAPALNGGLLYLRDDKEIVCIDVRKH